MIAVANGTIDNPASTMIHCYRVTVKKQLDTLTLTSQSLPSFFLTGGAARDIPGMQRILNSINIHKTCHFPAIKYLNFQI